MDVVAAGVDRGGQLPTLDEPCGQARGRKSLSGKGDSPQIRVRVPVDLRERADALAARQGVTVSVLTRKALEDAVQAAEPTQRPEVAVQRELHRALLAKLLKHGLAPYGDLIRKNLDAAREHVRGQQAHGWLDAWASLVEEPSAELLTVMLGDDDDSIDLRQVSPFAGVLTDEERLAAINAARHDASR